MKKLDELKKIYFEILSTVDSSLFDKKHPLHDKKLSGLFLTSFHPDYFNSTDKIMLIGAETRGWNVYRECKELDENYILENYIEGAIKRHDSEIREILSTPPSNKREFYNLFKKIIKHSGNKRIIYNNLFSFSYNKKSPINTLHYNEIRELSKKLLFAELEFYKPDILIFANGLGSACFRKELFPLDQCINRKDFVLEGIPNKQLWQFSFNDYLCFRLTHPSARGKMAIMNLAQDKMIEMLPKIND